MKQEIVAGIVFIILGALMVIFREALAKTAVAFYKAFYTEKNLNIVFVVVGIFFIIVAAILFLTA